MENEKSYSSLVHMFLWNSGALMTNQRQLPLGSLFALLFVVLVGSAVFVNAQSSQEFYPSTQFEIPQNNTFLSFAVNGTYTQATQENGFWTFTNLRLNNSVASRANVDTFKVSTQNANITILSCQRSSFGGGTGVTMRYLPVGSGVQIFYFNLTVRGGNWLVAFGSEYIDEGNGWRVSPNGTLTVNGDSGKNVSVSYIVFSNDLGNPSASDQSFYQQHSVAITTGIAFCIVIIITVAITLRNRVQANHALVQSRNPSNVAQSTKLPNQDD